jgi:hypothetical protein
VVVIDPIQTWHSTGALTFSSSFPNLPQTLNVPSVCTLGVVLHELCLGRPYESMVEKPPIKTVIFELVYDIALPTLWAILLW